MKMKIVIKLLSLVGLIISVYWCIKSSFDFEPILALLASIIGFLSTLSSIDSSSNNEKFSPRKLYNIGSLVHYDDFKQTAKTYGFKLVEAPKTLIGKLYIYIQNHSTYGQEKFNLEFFSSKIFRSISLKTYDKKFYKAFKKFIHIRKFLFNKKEEIFTKYNEELRRTEIIKKTTFIYRLRILIKENFKENEHLFRRKKIEITEISLIKNMPIEFNISFTYYSETDSNKATFLLQKDEMSETKKPIIKD